MLLASLAIATALLLVAILAVFARLDEHRIDVPMRERPFGGRSAIWQVNAFSMRNYSSRGRRLLRLHFVLVAVLAVVLVFALRLVLLR